MPDCLEAERLESFEPEMKKTQSEIASLYLFI